MLKHSTGRGMAGFTKAVFSAIAYNTALTFSDKVILTSQKGRPVRKNSDSIEKFSFINVEENRKGDGVSIEIFAILRFGTSISGFAESYADRLRQETEVITGARVDNVTINILGIRSKRTVRRELRITC